jgi:hypothetical protein
VLCPTTGTSEDPVNVIVSYNSSGAYAVYEFSPIYSRGGVAQASFSMGVPAYMKISSTDLSPALVELRNVSFSFLSEYPNGIPIVFEPLVVNDLTGETMPLIAIPHTIEPVSGDIEDLMEVGNNLALYAHRDLELFVNASLNVSNAYFYAEDTIPLHGVVVSGLSQRKWVVGSLVLNRIRTNY